MCLLCKHVCSSKKGENKNMQFTEEIASIHARQIIDSRGNPTIEVDVTTENGAFGRAAVPSGASTGEREALELRDGDKKVFGGKGVLKAVKNVNEIIAPKLVGMNVFEQVKIDETMIALDGTPTKSNLGANAMLGGSRAAAKAAANGRGLPRYRYIGGPNAKKLPVPMMNFINGGKHADSSVAFQEYMIMPVGAKSFSQAIEMGAETFAALRKIFKDRKDITAVGDEGGFAPNGLKSNEEPLEVLVEAIKAAGYVPGKDICLGMDLAASEFYDDEKKKYVLKRSGQGEKTSEEMIDMIASFVEKYPLITVEDALAENDWDGWVRLTAKLGDKVQLVGDDLYVTNPKYVQKGIDMKASNSVLIKLNQIGTLTETLDACEIGRAH